MTHDNDPFGDEEPISREPDWSREGERVERLRKQRPRVGDRMHFWALNSGVHNIIRHPSDDGPQPFAAIVTYVWTDGMSGPPAVNLIVYDHGGKAFEAHRVPVVGGPWLDTPTGRAWCERRD